MKNLTLLLFIVYPIIAFTQTVKITGFVIENEIHNPMHYAEVSFNSNYIAISNEKGHFELYVPRDILQDTLKIKFIGYFTIHFIHIPTNEDVVDLGIIPMFEYFPGHDMADFDCPHNDVECQRKKQQHNQQEIKRIDDYYTKVHKAINEYNYIFRNTSHKIDVINGCIDLGKK